LALFRKIIGYIDSFLLVVSVVCIVSASIIMAVSVLWRDLLSLSLVWAEEVTRYVTICAVFFLVGPLVRKGMHIRIVFLYVLFSPRLQKILDAFICCLGMFVCTACVIWSKEFIDLLIDVGAKSISGTPLDPWTWQIPVIVGMGIGVVSFLDEFFRILGVEERQTGERKAGHSA
jgi:TRAP-type C4-dicarboxylate transport system permease small subunit